MPLNKNKKSISVRIFLGLLIVPMQTLVFLFFLYFVAFFDEIFSLVLGYDSWRSETRINPRISGTLMDF